MTDGRLLRFEEVAQRLSISYNRARVLILYDKLIPYVTVGARGIRVREEELEKYIASLSKKEESGSKGNVSKGSQDTRELYRGRGIPVTDSGRDKPPLKEE